MIRSRVAGFSRERSESQRHCKCPMQDVHPKLDLIKLVELPSCSIVSLILRAISATALVLCAYNTRAEFAHNIQNDNVSCRGTIRSLQLLIIAFFAGDTSVLLSLIQSVTNSRMKKPKAIPQLFACLELNPVWLFWHESLDHHVLDRHSTLHGKSSHRS